MVIWRVCGICACVCGCTCLCICKGRPEEYGGFILLSFFTLFFETGSFTGPEKLDILARLTGQRAPRKCFTARVTDMSQPCPGFT